VHDLPIIGYTAFPTSPMSPELIRKPLHYDRSLRRLWIKGQRCHHGATGALLASMGAAALAAGGLLMAHDWKDRALWFARGWQDQQ
jgi:hypothetical protein